MSDQSSPSISRRSFLQRAGGFLAAHWALTGATAGGAGLLAWAEHDTLALKHELWDLYYPNLPAPAEGKTILQLSDLHLESLQLSPSRLYNAVSAYDPDLLVFTGDLISDRTDLDKVEDYLKNLPSRYGKYFVMGNNDYEHFSNALRKRFTALLETLGWTMLFNDAAYIPSLQLTIIGVDDPATAHDDTTLAYAKSRALIPPQAGDVFRLVLAHSSDCLDDVRDCGGADLLLCGHTHGGQIRLPGLRPLLTNTYLGEHGYYEGYHVVDKIPLYINRGIGTSVIPLRFNVTPEIALFTLQKGEEAARHK